MIKSELRYLECEGLKIALSIETQENCVKHDVYNPQTFLMFIQKGTIEIDTGDEFYYLKAGTFYLSRKHLHGSFKKSCATEDGNFKMIAFILEDSFVKDVIGSITLPENPPPLTQKIYEIPPGSILTGLMNSIEGYFEEREKINSDIIRLKTLESIIGILQAKPQLAHVFFEFSKSVKADLKLFMEKNYMQKYTLEEYASLSGRSISTFNREFRRLFNKSPHQWIKEKRLTFAKNLLVQSDLTSSEIYLQAGFEDLAHFSRSFKNHFGINPSRAKEIFK
jgi:AraC family transcriptional regulator, exoenzyme S synthesis regulatory protein ExsA